MRYGWRTGEVPVGFWWGDVMEGDHWECVSLRGRMILKWIFKKWDVEAWTRLIRHRTGTGGGRL